MSDCPQIKILSGGVSDEREVSLRTGECLAEALGKDFNVELLPLDVNQLPADIDAGKDVVFPAIHGKFGEDGELQSQLEAAGVIYAGCDAISSRLCMHKSNTKDRVSRAGVPVPAEFAFEVTDIPDAGQVVNELGEKLIVKPIHSGSSVGLFATDGKDDLENVFSRLDSNTRTRSWMVESRIEGREMTIGVLLGEPMGLVEVIPTSGLYDFEHKYTAGNTDYQYPAKVSEELRDAISRYAVTAFEACGCRDFARIDFMLSNENEDIRFLEINTIPGLTETSLMPKSVKCKGIDFTGLVQRMLMPALERFSFKSKLK